MKRFVVIVLLLCCTIGHAQTLTQPSATGTSSGTSAPTGTCGAGALYTNTTNGTLYSCSSGTWVQAGSTPGAVANAIYQTGLVVQYALTETTGTVVHDTSGNGNNGTLCASTAAPAWIGVPTGGLQFTASNSTCFTVPAALNTVQTWQIFANIQPQFLTGSGYYTCLMAGNGTPKANANGFCTYDNGSTPAGFGNSGTFNPTVMLDWKGGAGAAITSVGESIGTNLYTWVQDATADILYTNGVAVDLAGGPVGSQGNQTSGVYQFGGVPATYVNSNSSFWTGPIYYILGYSGELTAAQVAQNAIAVNQIMQNRNLTYVSGWNPASPTNAYVIDGDSLPGANNAWLQYAFLSNTNASWQAFYTGTAGWGTANLLNANKGALRDDDWCPVIPSSGNCILNVQIGTNNLPPTLSVNIPQYASFIQQRRASGKYNQIWVNTVLDSTTGTDAGKNTFNTALRENWANMGATGLIDIGGDSNLGCDGCSTNTTYFTTGLHPTAVGQYIIAHIQQPTINRIASGNFNFSSANVYTTTAAAATTITAASESTNTVTFTFSATPANFVVGTDLTITGVTPAGYNTSTANICHILGRSATQVSCLNPTTGLGVGTVFGTAAAPMQLDADATVRLAGSATSPQFTLASCASYVGGVNLPNWDGRVRLKNENTTSPWVIVPWASSSELIDGASTLTMPAASSGNFPVVVLEAKLTSTNTGGCSWTRIQ
jgi:hypothetical protein